MMKLSTVIKVWGRMNNHGGVQGFDFNDFKKALKDSGVNIESEIEISKACLKGVHEYSFRCGESAKIIGFVMMKPDGCSMLRPCFEVEYSDKVIDYVPLENFQNGEVEIVEGFDDGVSDKVY
jgi:hypothetical protein